MNGIEKEWRSDDGSIVLYQGDCLKILPQIDAQSVACVVADPPYDVRAGNGGGVFGQRDHLVKTGGFTDGGCDYSFLSRFSNWFSFCSRKQLRSLIEAAEKCDRFNVLTWCKPNPVPTCCNKYLPDVEFIVHGFATGRLFGDMSVKSCFMVYPCGQKVTKHPNEKPLPLMQKLLALGSIEGELICDPYMGSGTTGVACVRTGRRFIGIELDQGHFETAKARLLDALAQSGMAKADSRGQRSLFLGESA